MKVIPETRRVHNMFCFCFFLISATMYAYTTFRGDMTKPQRLHKVVVCRR